MSRIPQQVFYSALCNDNDLTYGINKLLLLVCAGMVIFMQVGMALWEIGSSRRKNTLTVFQKYLYMNIYGGLAFWIIGYAWAFGHPESSNGFIGALDYYGG